MFLSISLLMCRNKEGGDGDNVSIHSSVSTRTCNSTSLDGASSTHLNGSPSKSCRKRERRPERRESGRFTSAAKLLRSLSRAPKEDSSTALSRSNPHYHSEGKGLKKKNAWTSERELSSSSSNKERSHSFCDKTEGQSRSPSAQDVGDDSSSSSKAEAVDSSFVCTSPRNSDVCKPSGLRVICEPDQLHQQQDKLMERDKDRRSIRKLTKDSGYETSPYSESDYAHIEQLVTGNTSDADVDTDGDGDDVTLAAESEGASEFTPSVTPVDSNTPIMSR